MLKLKRGSETWCANPLIATLCGALILKAGFLAAAPSRIGEAVQNLHLSPQQLLSLRDFLGRFDYGTELETEASARFVLRDPASKAYVGELNLEVSGDGVLRVDRISGSARLDLSSTVRLPLHTDRKTEALIAQALSGSQMLESADEADKKSSILIRDSLAALDFSNTPVAGNIVESRALFFPRRVWIRSERAFHARRNDIVRPGCGQVLHANQE